MRLAPKLFPAENIANLLPPVRTYTFDDALPAIPYQYFENAGAVPFEVDARDCSLVNAWWLGDAAMLAYSGPHEIEAACAAAGFETVQFFSQQIPSRGTWFTGHSLGAGLATLAAVEDGQASGIYTFGSPRVGDDEFRKWFDSHFGTQAWRFVNNRDIISRMPLGDYEPVGGLKFIDGAGSIGNVEKSAETFEGLDSLIHLVREHAADHAPLRYQIHIWNEVVKSAPTSPKGTA